MKPDLDARTKRATRHKIAIFCTVILTGIIAYLTLTSMSGIVVFGSDKLQHFIAFAGLTLPVSVLFRQSLRWMVPAFIVFGGAIEIIQPYVHRAAEWNDFWADVAGIIAAVVVGVFIRRIIKIQS